MPARSVAQRRAIAIAEHNPSKSYSRNRALAEMKPQDQSDFASTPEAGLPQYVGKYGGGGAVDQPPPSLYGQGGEVDVSMSAKPQLPSTPSMQQPTMGYAMGGVVISPMMHPIPMPGPQAAPAPAMPRPAMPPAMPPARPAPPMMGKKPAPKMPPKAAAKKPMGRAERVKKFEKDNADTPV